eukprot:804254-Prymnesium_polylepis.1
MLQASAPSGHVDDRPCWRHVAGSPTGRECCTSAGRIGRMRGHDDRGSPIGRECSPIGRMRNEA